MKSTVITLTQDEAEQIIDTCKKVALIAESNEDYESAINLRIIQMKLQKQLK